MKRQIISLAFTIIFTLFAYNGFSQDAPPPPGNHGGTGNQQPGGNAPLGSGLLITFVLSVAYGGKKFYNMKKEQLES